MKKIAVLWMIVFASLLLLFCSACGPKHEHAFVLEVVNETYLKSNATCVAKAVYYKSCECGEKGTETFEYGELLSHEFSVKCTDAIYLKEKANRKHNDVFYYSCHCGAKGDETFETDTLIIADTVQGKRITFIGDSITCGVGATNGNGFVNQVQTLGECTVNNLGISGSCLCLNGSLYSSYNVFNSQNIKHSDIVVICLGVNDWQCASNKPSENKVFYDIGNVNSTDPSTIYGALRMYCNDILSFRQTDEYKNTQFVFATPMVTKRNSSAVDSDLSYLRNGNETFNAYKTNPFGRTYLDYLQPYYYMSELYDIPLIDLYYTSGIYYNSESDNNANSLMPDGIHPNDEGHLCVANAIIDGLNKILNQEYKYRLEEKVENGSNISNGTMLKGTEQIIDLHAVNKSEQLTNHNTFDALWIPNVKYNGKFNRIDYIATQGNVTFYKVSINGSAVDYYYIGGAYNDFSEEGQVKSIYIDEELNDEYIAVSGSFYWNPYENYYKCYTYALSNKNLSVLNPQTFFYNVSYDSTFTKNDLDEFSQSRENEVVLLDVKPSAGDASFTYSGRKEFTDDGVVVSDRIFLNKYYSLSDRTITYSVHLNDNSVCYFETTENLSTPNSHLIIDMNNSTVQTSFSEARRVEVLDGEGDYEICISKYMQYYIVEIYKGEQSFTTVFRQDSSGGVGDGVVNYKTNGVSMQWDYYCFRSANSFVLKNIKVTTSKYDVLLYGDSITEPESYYPACAYDNSWTRLFMKAITYDTMSSGRGGTNIYQINARRDNEIKAIMPKYVIITIGTNGSNTEENLTELVRYLKDLGITPILNHIPCFNHCGDEVGYKYVNDIIDVVRAKENVKGIDFDKATTANGGCDESMMWKENYGGSSLYYHHPNNKGAFYMLEQAMKDVPELFLSNK